MTEHDSWFPTHAQCGIRLEQSNCPQECKAAARSLYPDNKNTVHAFVLKQTFDPL